MKLLTGVRCRSSCGVVFFFFPLPEPLQEDSPPSSVHWRRCSFWRPRAGFGSQLLLSAETPWVSCSVSQSLGFLLFRDVARLTIIGASKCSPHRQLYRVNSFLLWSLDPSGLRVAGVGDGTGRRGTGVLGRLKQLCAGEGQADACSWTKHSGALC